MDDARRGARQRRSGGRRAQLARSTTWPTGSRSRSRSSARTATAAASSSPTSATSCARRSRRCAPSTSCSSRAPAEDPATRDEFLRQSRTQVERLDWLAANLLELSRLDSGLVALDLRDDDLRGVAESAVENAAADRGSQGRHARAGRAARSPSSSRTTRRASARCSPTSSATPSSSRPSGGHVRVGLEPTPEGARFTVADDGVGIDPAELEHVFDRFYRGTRVSRGAGQRVRASGLAIVRSIVDMHEGRVAITQQPGRRHDGRGRPAHRCVANFTAGGSRLNGCSATVADPSSQCP